MSDTFWTLSGVDWALLGGGAAAILAGTGSAIGITHASGVITGIVSEEPEKFGKLLPLAAIAGTQGIYGFISAVLVLSFFNILGGNAAIPGAEGFKIFLACLPVGFVCLTSGIYQGLTAASAAGIVARRGEDAGKALIFPALVETYAVLSLIITILMLLSIQAVYGG